jgi:hypothetical protein
MPKIDRRHVIISKDWAPEAPIHIRVTDIEIGVAMELEHFVQAVVKEMGNPAMLLTNHSLNKKLVAAVSVVCERMKAETAKVM